jgi:hypothetical protein
MRVTVGILSIVGLSISVAASPAQAPRGPAAPQRRATLLPPEAVHPSELPAVARAAAEELPANPAMTPVPRSAQKGGAVSPAWLAGTDAQVRPAGGTVGAQPQVRPLTPRTSKDDASPASKGLDRMRGALGGAGRPDERAPGNLPPGVAAVTANANTPFRGTAPNGAPVYAGPPAYRWYGWGSVTPGANPYAPTGQYPPASANWFSITGATPGAFPVPVQNPNLQASGTEPPAYATTPERRVTPVSAGHLPAARGGSVTHLPPPPDMTRAEPQRQQPATPVPMISPPPPITVPLMTPPPAPGTTDQEPPIRPVGSVPSVAPLPVISVGDVAEGAGPQPLPESLPVSASEEKTNWQPGGASRSPADWNPARDRPQTPPASPAQNWQQPGAGRPTQGQPVARGQADESRPDSTTTLIRRLCDGRATGVDVRWTGSQRLTVRFDCRTTEAARSLAKDISARPELSPLQIEFSVLVK